MKRLFIGIELPSHIKEIALRARELFKDKAHGIRWIPPENLHLTIQFLGRCEESKIEKIENILSKATLGGKPVSFQTEKLGAFPNAGKARILWLGLKESDVLKNIYERISAGLEAEGFALDKKSFQPHITIARLKAPKQVPWVNEKMDNIEKVFLVEAVSLFESRLLPTGVKYEVLKKYILEVRVKHEARNSKH